jgi:hypothetical protein
MIPKKDQMIVKLMVVVKEQNEIISALTDEPSIIKRMILKRKLKIINEKLPRLANDIKNIGKRRSLYTINLNTLLTK